MKPRMRMNSWLCVLLATVASTSARAETDFVEGWRALVTQSPAYTAVMARASSGQAKADQAKALWRPQVFVSASAGWATQRTDVEGAGFTAPGFGTSQDVAFRTQVDQGLGTEVALVAQQPLFQGSRQASSRQLEAMAELALLQGQAERQGLIWRLVETHLHVLHAREAVRTAQAEVASATQAADAARERYETGAAPITAVHDAHARRDQARASGLQAQQALAVAQLAYRQLIAQPDAQPAELAEPFVTGPALDEESVWQERARAQSLMRRIAEVSVTIARAEVDKHSMAASSSLDLVGRVSDERLRGEGPHASGGQDARSSARNQWVGLRWQMPLYTGGMDSAQHREAALALEAALARQQEADQLVERDMRAAWLGAQAAQAQVEAARQARRSAQERLGATRTGFDVGHRTVLDLLDAERDALQADTRAMEARHQVVLSRLRLEALCGALDESALARVNDWLSGHREGDANPP